MHGNHCQRWTDSDVDELRLLASENMHIGLIARRLNRTPQSIRAKAAQLHTSLARTSVLKAELPALAAGALMALAREDSHVNEAQRGRHRLHDDGSSLNLHGYVYPLTLRT